MDNLDWRNLGFGYMKTDYNVRCYYRNGKWGRLELHSDEYVPMHMAATCLHYGQEAFEGQKAFMGKDGKVRVFRVEENARRMQSSADYLQMQPVPVELFVEAVKTVVDANRRFVPPYGTGATLYIRPLLIGSGAKVGVSPADEYLFIVFVTPVGPYYKEGFRPIRVMIDRDHDRAAPHGTGHVKAGGNYGASLISEEVAHKRGYPGILYLDSAEKKYIDECGTSNFFAIRDGKYITPHSHSILPSITNMSLRTIAEQELGLGIEQRKVEAAELPTFEEVGCCGTAAVISPIKSIYDPQSDHTYVYCDGDEAGPVCTRLFHRLQGIQFGESEDSYGWMTEV
ncbi:MAG: branched-chain amino acid aminotransferase [Rikenellaceae bacterium]|nr:branched-chain amino acid aminotransferase [Rikenellaceae bacterium]